MHAWAIISHYLDYKTPHAVPSELKRDFNALSGLFYVADLHFEMFFKSSKVSRKKAAEVVKSKKTNEDTEINFDTLSAYLKKEFPDREHSDAQGVSVLIEEMNKVGIKSIKALDDKLKLGHAAFTEYEKKYPPGVQPGEQPRFLDVGVLRITLQIVDKAFRELLTSKFPKTKAINDARYDEFQALIKSK